MDVVSDNTTLLEKSLILLICTLSISACTVKPPVNWIKSASVSFSKSSKIKGFFTSPETETVLPRGGIKIWSLCWIRISFKFWPLVKYSYKSKFATTSPDLITWIFLNEPSVEGPPAKYNAVNAVE